MVLSVIAMHCDSAVAKDEGKPQGVDETKREWGEAVQGQAISIATAKPVYAVGERITLNIQFKNVSSSDVKAVVTNPLDAYEITVILPTCKEAPHTL
jgi:hypothetical protein